MFSPLVFIGLAAVFIFKIPQSHSPLVYVAYSAYALSTYALVIVCMCIPRASRAIKALWKQSALYKWIASTRLGGRYLRDLEFRGSLSIHQGIIVNAAYVVFRVIAGIRFASLWFIAIAVYYLVIGAIRVYLIVSYRKRDVSDDGKVHEKIVYRNTAWLLLLLNIPMGIMILMMIVTNSGFEYPEYVIYFSALYTFYTLILAIWNVIKYRKVGSPILSASKILNFVSAMMSVLALQTAMLSMFSERGEEYRRLMNIITGAVVFVAVIVIVAYMLIKSRTYAQLTESVSIDE